MEVAFRADSSTEIGTGHVMRCLALARELKRGGAKIRFISRNLPGNIRESVVKPEFPVIGEETKDLPALDWLVVDHYDLDREWESAHRGWARRILVIDDLANRPHDCDLLVDQTFVPNPQARYEKLVPRGCPTLLGPEFALLRDEFKSTRAGLKSRAGALKKVFLFFGGVDPTNETAKALTGLKLLGRKDLVIDVVAGASNPHCEELERLCRETAGGRLHVQPPSVAKLMSEADLAFGAGGSTTWERCCLGLPTVVTILDDNQVKLTEEAARRGLLISLGLDHSLTPESYARAFEALTPAQLVEMSKQCMMLVDGNGCFRVAKAMASG